MIPKEAVKDQTKYILYLTWAFGPSAKGGGGRGGGGIMTAHNNFLVYALLIRKFSTTRELDVFYILVTKICDLTIIT